MEAPLMPIGVGLRRSVSAPSLDTLCQSALSLETSPCTLEQLHALDDEMALKLRRTLAETQRELQAAIEAGVLRNGAGGGSNGGRQYTSDSQEGGSDGEEGASGQGSGGRRRSGNSGRQRSRSAGTAGTAAGGSGSMAADAEEELELAGLSAREREAAIKRAKNREAARRSRERKMERIATLQAEAGRLTNDNFVLLKCVEEVAIKALHARAENLQLKEKLATVVAANAAAVEAAAAAAGPGSAACTPPPARRAAALERELLLMEAAPRSPTHLMLPLWPDHTQASAAAAAAAAAQPPLRPLPTSAELRRELREALAGGADARGDGSAADHHLLHPSPSAAATGSQPRGRRQLHATAGPLQHASVLQVKEAAGGSLIRACSAPGSLLRGAAAEAGAVQELQQPWLNHRGLAA